MRSVPLRLYVLALCSAMFQLLPFPIAAPVPAWRRLFCWFCLVPLLLALRGRNAHGRPVTLLQSALIAYLCGVAWFAGNCYWIYQTMFLYGNLSAPLSAIVLILFSLYLGLYFGLFGACFSLVARWKGRGAATWLSPFLWVAIELARSRITGFPWDPLGNALVDNLFLTRLAPWTGVMGLSLLVAAVNCLWLWQPKLHSRRLLWAGPVAAVGIVSISYLGSLSRPGKSPESAVATLVQDNLEVGSAEAYSTPPPVMLATLATQSLHPEVTPEAAALLSSEAKSLPGKSTDLILWPEAPTSFRSADPAFRQAIGRLARSAHAPVIVDADASGQTPNAKGRYDEFVSASFFLPDGTFAGRYDKMHLVPFGEYTPYKQLFFFAGHLLDGLNFVPGTRRTLFSVEGHRYGVFICYESIFGDEIRQFALHGAQAFVNLSDDGWYGDTSAPWEHLDMARMRAIENARWLLLDTNTGLTASVDPYGRIVAQMPRHLRGAIEVPFDYRNDLTFYTRYGDWLGWICAILTGSVLIGGPLQQRFPYRPAQTK